MIAASTADRPRLGGALAATMEHAEAPQAHILRELEGASLRLVERRLSKNCRASPGPTPKTSTC